MTEFITAFRTAFVQYFSSIGIYPFLALIGMMLVIRKGRPVEKRILVYIPLCIFAVTACNPVYWKVAGHAADYAYSRSYWLIPVFLLISCTAVAYLGRLNIRRTLVLAAVIILCCITWGAGISNLYTVKSAHTAENIYKLPQDAVDVAEAIKADTDDRINLLAPDEINMYVRQYDATINLIYNSWNEEVTFFEKSFVLNGESRLVTCKSVTEEMNKDIVDVEYIIAIQPHTDWNYLVLKNSQYDMEDEFVKNGLKIVSRMDNYTLFVKNDTGGDTAYGK